MSQRVDELLHRVFKIGDRCRFVPVTLRGASPTFGIVKRRLLAPSPTRNDSIQLDNLEREIKSRSGLTPRGPIERIFGHRIEVGCKARS